MVLEGKGEEEGPLLHCTHLVLNVQVAHVGNERRAVLSPAVERACLVPVQGHHHPNNHRDHCVNRLTDQAGEAEGGGKAAAGHSLRLHPTGAPANLNRRTGPGSWACGCEWVGWGVRCVCGVCA